MNGCKTIAICNQKGGVGKTTTALNLGVGLAKAGRRVLLIDADPQSDLTSSLGWEGDKLDDSLGSLMYQVIRDSEPAVRQAILHHEEGVDLIPSNLDLSMMETQLVNAMSREKVLSTVLKDVKADYDYILIDCMPSLGMITVNALTASDSVIIPVQAQYDKYGRDVLDSTIRLDVSTWEGEKNSFSRGVLTGIAIIINAYGDSINEDIFMDKVGQISVKQIVRTAKERGGGSRGFAETMMLAYNSKNKYRLSMRKLYGKKSAKYESGDDDGDE